MYFRWTLAISVGFSFVLKGFGECVSSDANAAGVCNDEPLSLLQTQTAQLTLRSFRTDQSPTKSSLCKSPAVENVEYTTDSYVDVPSNFIKSGIQGKPLLLAYPDDVTLTDPSIIEIPANLASKLALPPTSRYLVSTTHFRGLPWETESPGCIGVKRLPKHRRSGYNRGDKPHNFSLAAMFLPDWRCSALRLMALDSHFCFVAQAILDLQTGSGGRSAMINAEDARLFLHNEKVWMTYNSYNKATCAQFAQPIRFHPVKEASFVARIHGDSSMWQGCPQAYGSSLEELVRKEAGAGDEMMVLHTTREMSLVEQTQASETFLLPGKNSGLFEYMGALYFLWSVDPVRTAKMSKKSPQGAEAFLLKGNHKYGEGA